MRTHFLQYILLFILCVLPHGGQATSLAPGMQGDEVKALQESLGKAGYLARETDGDYGSTTAKAVSLFQEAKKLPVTGIADDVTRSLLAQGGAGRVGGGVLYVEGNRGLLVGSIQQALQREGYFKGLIDGVYGADTVRAVETFQEAHEIPVSGFIDEMTWFALMGEASREKGNAEPKYEPVKVPVHGFMKKGDRGDDVSRLQELLKQGKYLDGMVDGIYGDGTERAVRAFQKEHKLSRTGIVNGETQKALEGLRKKPREDGKALREGARGKTVIQLQNQLLFHGFPVGRVDGVYGGDTVRAVKNFRKAHKLKGNSFVDGEVWKALQAVPKPPTSYKKKFSMESTAYTPYEGSDSGKTAMGNYSGKGHAAVDPKIIPLGSIVYIEGYGYAICDDIGGAIHGHIIDVGMDTLDEAYAWGRRYDVQVYLVQ